MEPVTAHAPGSTRRLPPDALRGHGITARPDAANAGRVDPQLYSFDLKPFTGYRNGLGIAEYTGPLADRVEEPALAENQPKRIGTFTASSRSWE